MNNKPTTPEELKNARKATAHFNRFFGYEFFTPESYIEMDRRIDKRLARRAYNEAMADVEAKRRKIEIRNDRVHVTIRNQTLGIPRPVHTSPHVYTHRQSANDDHDANNSLFPNTKPGGLPSGFLAVDGACGRYGR